MENGIPLIILIFVSKLKLMPIKFHIFLTVVCLFEFLMVGPQLSSFGPYISPIIFALLSSIVGIFAFYASFNHNKLNHKEASGTLNKFTSTFIACTVFVILVYFAFSVFSKHPIDDNYSDVFAQVLSAASWLWNGAYPYQEVILPTYTMHNTYLPMQWLPFILPIAFDFDPRWLPILIWVFALLFFIYYYNFNYDWKTVLVFLLTLLAITLGVAGYIYKNPQEYSATLELLPASYYILLVLFMLKRSWLGTGIFMGFCLLSRFSIVLLIPFLIYYAWTHYGKYFLYKSIFTSISVVLFLFVVPFMTQDTQLPQKIIANYDNGAAGEWRVHDWQNEGDLPYQISRGTGWAIYFRDRHTDDLLKGVKSLKKWGFSLSLLCGFLLIWIHNKFKDRIEKKWYLLAAIKIYFTVFYTFVLIPYTYLYLIPLSISAVILLYSFFEWSKISHYQRSVKF